VTEKHGDGSWVRHAVALSVLNYCGHVVQNIYDTFSRLTQYRIVTDRHFDTALCCAETDQQ